LISLKNLSVFAVNRTLGVRFRPPPPTPNTVHDSETGKQESLGTLDRVEATTLLNARNESVRQPQLNLQIAKAYLAGTDSGVSTRTWQSALDAIVETKSGSTKDRWRRAGAIFPLRNSVCWATSFMTGILTI